MKYSAAQLLCRMKDSAVLLQKRLVQERDQEQAGRDSHTLKQYKVNTTRRTQQHLFLFLKQSDCMLHLVVCLCVI